MTDATRPDEAAVEALEKSLTLPEDAYPLKNYERYYSISNFDGRSMLVGTYYYVGPERLGSVHFEPSGLPFYHDGGCDIVHVYASEDGKTLQYVACNGEA